MLEGEDRRYDERYPPPPEWIEYLRLRKRAARRRRLIDMFGWSDEEYRSASHTFCDWALALDDLHQKARERLG